MSGRLLGRKLTSFQIIILGFLTLILAGTVLLMIPACSSDHQWTQFEDALFTSASAVCVTGLVVRDTAIYWSVIGQIVILILIMIGGLGIVSVTAFAAMVSGRRISLLQRSMLQESISAHQIGGIVKMTGFVFKAAFAATMTGAAAMMPSFCRIYGPSGIWMSVFHSVSAFCNAGFDIMGDRTGEFSSFTSLADSAWIVMPICLLIVAGGIGFLTWDDVFENRLDLKNYRMQSKVILTVTSVLIFLPATVLFFSDFSCYPLKERLCLSLFQAITPRTAGFNTADLDSMTSAGHTMLMILMLIGGSPGSTAGGVKTTTIAILFANASSVVRRKKSTHLFGRRVDECAVRSAGALLIMYLTLVLTGAMILSIAEDLPAGVCLFEAISAIGTVGLSLGITSSLGTLSRLVLIVLMFFGRVGGLTLMFAAVNSRYVEPSRFPVEKISVG